MTAKASSICAEIGTSDVRLHRNRLLNRLDRGVLQEISTELQYVQLDVGDIIFRELQPIEHVYFPTDGAASIVATAMHGGQSEVALFGREASIVPALTLGADRIPHRCEVQMPMKAFRLEAKRLRSWMDRDRRFHDDLLAFAQVTTVQITCTTLANAVDRVPQRLARWLLMYHDRSASDDLALKHATLGKMLSVRRSSVTEALHVLEGERMIQADRGCIQIKDRSALLRFTEGSYGMPETAYAHLIEDRPRDIG